MVPPTRSFIMNGVHRITQTFIPCLTLTILAIYLTLTYIYTLQYDQAFPVPGLMAISVLLGTCLVSFAVGTVVLRCAARRRTPDVEASPQPKPEAVQPPQPDPGPRPAPPAELEEERPLPAPPLPRPQQRDPQPQPQPSVCRPDRPVCPRPLSIRNPDPGQPKEVPLPAVPASPRQQPQRSPPLSRGNYSDPERKTKIPEPIPEESDPEGDGNAGRNPNVGGNEQLDIHQARTESDQDTAYFPLLSSIFKSKDLDGKWVRTVMESRQRQSVEQKKADGLEGDGLEGEGIEGDVLPPYESEGGEKEDVVVVVEKELGGREKDDDETSGGLQEKVNTSEDWKPDARCEEEEEHVSEGLGIGGDVGGYGRAASGRRTRTGRRDGEQEKDDGLSEEKDDDFDGGDTC